jgi:hypothetical protein
MFYNSGKLRYKSGCHFKIYFSFWPIQCAFIPQYKVRNFVNERIVRTLVINRPRHSLLETCWLVLLALFIQIICINFASIIDEN